MRRFVVVVEVSSTDDNMADDGNKWQIMKAAISLDGATVGGGGGGTVPTASETIRKAAKARRATVQPDQQQQQQSLATCSSGGGAASAGPVRPQRQSLPAHFMTASITSTSTSTANNEKSSVVWEQATPMKDADKYEQIPLHQLDSVSITNEDASSSS
ncbi:unnamed protein product [Notodromas monacha]|uniref:Uncharacterized protein n=1 Tax=Notodromas monacha TaxID=399045 RepID=A0A7R9BZN1_9CRUS|nr:unnamed protein product [Notodromas monacha]CAG0924620.1 unnamed protein product [Notodromas monacha]